MSKLGKLEKPKRDGAPHIGERTEAKLTAILLKKIGELRPQLSLAKDNRSAIERVAKVLLVPTCRDLIDRAFSFAIGRASLMD